MEEEEQREEGEEEGEKEGRRELEFGGAVGVMVNMVTMPLTIYLTTAACDQEACTVSRMPRLPRSPSAYFDPGAALFYVAWLAAQVFLHLAIPGRIVAGAPLANKTTICYICNGFQVLLVTFLGFIGFSFICPSLAFLLTERSFGVITSASAVSIILSIFLYRSSFTVKTEALSAIGNTGVMLYDFYMGRELNPHLGPLDLKFFCELRPGLLLWGVMDISYVINQWHRIGHVEFELAALVFCHLLYIVDALFFEDTVLTTLDITSEGFGFMLAFGDLVWVPFVFSLHARFLAFHPQHNSKVFILAILALNGFGYYIFRASNNEKDKFRRHPGSSGLKGLRTLETPCQQSGLLVDGWWGWLRHPNYLGDFLMAFSWTLLCGFGHFVPCIYLFYLSLALLHRTKRDDKKCEQKYRETWLKYKRMVPYCMVPYVY
ncbi:hypothetical protein CAPTEDRAFT_139617 [Capitella teleta]|uniref:Steroid 5-alpha reductase C-terminal domain-containing protein n=1 Tax=Capitella teleta TaxID=283909 RepID=R7TRE4_CAPTE|nr:hypothetical protein CAPTEDRAFT_139617 [Capitella teleta]|eukprot:ELT94066.1 hypothetical protein CAPTEDRAFT_139617 [Capitella teleta]